MALATHFSAVQTGAMTRASHRITEIAVLTASLYAARRYYRNWGATKEECQMRLPDDEMVGDPAIQVTEATWIDAPPSTIWPWLLQIGHVGDLIGLPADSAERVDSDFQQLVEGDFVRLIPKGLLGQRDGPSLRVESIIPGRRIVLRTASPNLPEAIWSFHLQPHWTNHTRLLARARVGLRHPGEVFAAELARPVIALLTRAVLVGIKRRVERQTNDVATSEFC
jgi:hypothetical protein